MKVFNINRTVIIGAFLAVMACNKPTEYRSYLAGKEIQYPGVVNNLKALPQVNQITLRFNPSTDQSITKYKVYWRNGADSMSFTPTTLNPAETENLVIPNLPESEVLNLTLYSINAKGISVPKVLNGVRSIGPVYLDNLKNRFLTNATSATFNPKKSPMDSIYLNFRADPDSFNVATRIYWVDKQGQQKISEIDATSVKIKLPDFKINTWVYFQSYYKPNRFTDESYTPKSGRDSFLVAQSLF
jgi:uncharacterized protein DUF4998